MNDPLEIHPALASELRRLLGQGVSVGELARRFGLPHLVVRMHRGCRPAKVARKRKPRRKAAGKRDEEIRRLWSDGWRGKELARRFKLSRGKVSAIVAGLPRENRSFGPEDHVRAEGSPPIPGPSRPPFPLRPIVREISIDPRDAVEGGPQSHRGSENPRAVLNDDLVVEMRRLRSEGWSMPRLSARFGVGRNTVCYALSGVTWGHVPE
jgi:hypothetical protein